MIILFTVLYIILYYTGFQFTFLWFTVIIMFAVEVIVVLKLYMNHTNIYIYILGGVCMGLVELTLSLLSHFFLVFLSRRVTAGFCVQLAHIRRITLYF